MDISELDKSIGMLCYSTSCDGIGGRIRSKYEDFQVEEIINPNLEIKENFDSTYRYPIYVLEKIGIDTIHACKMIEMRLGSKIRYLGLKDAKAFTKQYVSPTSLKAHLLKDFQIDNKISLKLIGYSSRPLIRRDLVGNKFKIKIVDVNMNYDFIERCLNEVMASMNEGKVPNFFGYQRFGSKRPINHLIGRALVKRNFDEALKILLSYPSIYDNEELKAFREFCKEENYQRALSMLKPELDIEGLVLKRLVKKPKASIEALREIPLSLRRLFVNAYQSYICNRVLSLAINAGMDLINIEKGDYYGEFDLTQGRLIKVSKSSLSNKQGKLIVPLIPIVGYAYRNTSNRFDTIINQMLEEEGVKAHDFYIKELPEVSMEGGFRVAPLICKNFNWRLNNEVFLTIDLFKGSYVTIILREIMKPKNPIEAGF
ncbi:MAG: tRNA pseudouridine(13) synthase TruD [Nitrososphaerales archaeon]